MRARDSCLGGAEGVFAMEIDFTYYNPTRIHFGRNALDALSGELAAYGESVLLMYGRNSVKKSGLYDKITAILKGAGKKVTELAGVKPNPTYAQLLEGARLVRENNVELILAVGGGSVIDCAKAVSVSAYCAGDPWRRYWIDFEEVDNRIVPVGSVLTMAGTGSEMNGGSVITNEALPQKVGRVYPPEVYPKFSILNPEYTFTVPESQMVSGIFDTLSHLMEQYFSGDDDNTTDYIIEGVMESLVNSARVAVENPRDYEARSNIMWCATVGLNTMTGLSKAQDWMAHMIEHQVSAFTDCPHGAGLAVISAPYYRYIYKDGLDKFARFAEKVWGVDAASMGKEAAALAGIDAMAAFARELGLPTTLRELGATEDMLPKIAATCAKGGAYRPMGEADVRAVLASCF